MAILELMKFREKYPQYKDIDDNALASKLATKYPDAYGDLPAKLESFVGGAKSPANLAAQEDLKIAQDKASPLGFAKEYPFLASLQGAPELLTGNTARDIVNKDSSRRQFSPQEAETYKQKWGQYPEKDNELGFVDQVKDLGAVAADTLTSPSNLLIGGISKTAAKGLGMAGDAIGNSAFSKAIGNYRTESTAVKDALSPMEALFTKPAGLPKSELVRKIEEQGKYAIGKIREEKKILDKSMFQESDKAAVDIQEHLPEYFKRNSTTYGKTIDKISDDLVNSNNQITRGELSGILDDVLKESQDDLLASGKPMQELEYLSNKYSLKPKVTESPILSESGNPITTQIDSTAGDPLDFKQVVEDIKGIRNSLSSKAKMGQNYTPEDVVAAKFAKRWGSYLETKVPELKELNQEYAPIIQTMKTAGKYFKPYSQGVDKLQGVSFLRNIAQDKLQTSEKKLLDILENGTPNFPGIGKKTANLENIKNMQGKVSKELDNTIKEYAANKSKAQDLLAREKVLKDQRNAVVGALTATGLLSGGGAYVGKKVAGR